MRDADGKGCTGTVGLLALGLALGWLPSACAKQESEQLQAIAERHELGDEAALEAMARRVWGERVRAARVDEHDGSHSLTLQLIYGDSPETTLSQGTFASSTLRHLALGACKLTRWGHGRKLAELRLHVLTRVGNRQGPVELYRVRLATEPVHGAVRAGCDAQASARIQAGWRVELDRTDRLQVHQR